MREFDCVCQQIEQNLLDSHLIHLQVNFFAHWFQLELYISERGLALQNEYGVFKTLQQVTLGQLGSELALFKHSFIEQHLYLSKQMFACVDYHHGFS